MEKERDRALQRRVCHSVWRTLQAAGCVIVLAAALACADATTAWAMDAGAYLVTVAPSYKDPETGSVDDPGNNAAIGQGMTERMCGSTGLLEVENSGEMYLTVRYYLSQFIRDVSFEERIGGNYVTRSSQAMQSRAADESAGDIGEKYGYTDYRIPISSMDSVFRGKAYIEAMGRNVVFFFTVSDARSGSGDFVVSSGTTAQTAVTDGSQDTQAGTGQGDTAVQTADTQTVGQISSGTQYVLTEETDVSEAVAGTQEQTSKWEELAKSVSGDEPATSDDWINGSGNADDPVTGIPAKPAVQSEDAGKYPISGAETTSAGSSGAAAAVAVSGSKETAPADYHLETSYNLSAVSLKEARKLTEPMLEAATGIAGIAGDLEMAETPEAGSEKKELNGNKLVMTILLGAAVLLFVWFAAAGAQPGGRGRKNAIEKGDGQANRKEINTGHTGTGPGQGNQEQTGGENGE